MLVLCFVLAVGKGSWEFWIWRMERGEEKGAYGWIDDVLLVVKGVFADPEADAFDYG
jgi:hypothetical protein